MHTIESNGYNIFFENSLATLGEFIRQGNYSKFFFLVDEETDKYCLPLIKKKLPDLDNYDIIEISSGEENKNIDFCIGIWRMLIDFGADRKSLLINVGGGVVTDMGGFAASTFKRGIDFVHVPTTLLSQVDASVGGKTGIDVEHLKNIIGTFTQPKAVFMEAAFLKTLSERQIVSGFAEMLKHGLIADKVYFDQLKNADPKNLEPKLIHRSVEIKNEVVKADPKEQGLRKILNFGHTIGHAIESYSLTHDSRPLTHGEAIAIGMICEARLAVTKQGLSNNECQEITDVFNRFYPKYHLLESSFSDLIDLMKNDKKNDAGQINCSLLTQIGHCAVDAYCTETELRDGMLYYTNLEQEC
ncbi:MAG: 3-dehydroquinate synthase [Sphingobacteriaceae bacterium]